MRISTQWLQELVPLPPAEQLAELLEMAGIGVENRQDDGDNSIFTLEVTSNRGDWLSAVGLAREIAAMSNTSARPVAVALQENAPQGVEVQIENGDDCARYSVRELTGVQVGPSPDWMQKRLVECGMRPINNVVDVTNFVMLEWGQPLHAFDADKVQAPIRVRRAKPGETLRTLDDVERRLDVDVLVIADARGPIALAGLMGGLDSEVTPQTTRVLLESAHFAPSAVRSGKRKMAFGTEASRRFERFVDPDGTMRASSRAARLLQEVAGATIGLATDRQARRITPAVVNLRASRCNAILGLKLSRDTMASLLRRLGMEVSGVDEDTLRVQAPTWRRDIEREIDLIEEVARLHGYGLIPTTLPRGVNPSAGRSLSQRLEERAKSALLRCGLTEILTLSLTSQAAVEHAGLSTSDAAMDTEAKPVRLRNPLSEDFAQLRTSLIPSLLETLGRNARGDVGPVRVFELGRIYQARYGNQQPDERRQLGLALLDAPASSHWLKREQSADFWALKSVLNEMMRELNAPAPQYRATQQAPFHPGRCALLSLDAQTVGVLGEVHPSVAENYDLNARATLAILDFDVLVRHIALRKTYAPLAKFPAAERDLALVVRSEIAADALLASLRRACGPLLDSLQIFDIYTGAPIPSGFKSVALSLRFRAPDRTLTEAEIEAAMTQARIAAERDFDAQLRA